MILQLDDAAVATFKKLFAQFPPPWYPAALPDFGHSWTGCASKINPEATIAIADASPDSDASEDLASMIAFAVNELAEQLRHQPYSTARTGRVQCETPNRAGEPKKAET